MPQNVSKRRGMIQNVAFGPIWPPKCPNQRPSTPVWYTAYPIYRPTVGAHSRCPWTTKKSKKSKISKRRQMSQNVPKRREMVQNVVFGLIWHHKCPNQCPGSPFCDVIRIQRPSGASRPSDVLLIIMNTTFLIQIMWASRYKRYVGLDLMISRFRLFRFVTSDREVRLRCSFHEFLDMTLRPGYKSVKSYLSIGSYGPEQSEPPNHEMKTKTSLA